MKTSNHSFINMSGNKRAIASQIFSVLDRVEDCSKLIYVEPFFGSGGAYCNLPYKFQEYKCSDIFPYIIGFVNANFAVEQLSMLYDNILGRYKIKDRRKDYFAFRQFWNDRQRENNLLQYGGFVLLANSCINGMIRFGPNGFNQAWGNRTMPKDKFLSLSSMVKPNSSFQVCDFRDVIYPHSSFVYLDPPYSDTGALTKMHGFWTWTSKEDDDLVDLFFDLDKKHCKVVLSTLENSFLHITLKDHFQAISISKHYKIAPSSRQAKSHKEIIITNA